MDKPPVKGLPKLLEVSLNALLEECVISSWIITGGNSDTVLKIRFTGSHDALDTGAISYRRKSASMMQRDSQRLKAFISAKEEQGRSATPGTEFGSKPDYTEDSPGKDSGMGVDLGGVDSFQSTIETRSPEQMSLGMPLDPNVTPFMPQPDHDNNKQSWFDPNTDPINCVGATADISLSRKEKKVKNSKEKYGEKNRKTAPQCLYCKTFFKENDFYFNCSQCLKEGKSHSVCPDCHPKDRPHNQVHINFISGKRHSKLDIF